MSLVHTLLLQSLLGLSTTKSIWNIFSAGETTENIAKIPVVQEQVIVLATPRVVDSLPPGAEFFTGPVYNPVHQEQFSAGETTENIANFPVVQEQVLVQAIPRFVGSLPPGAEFTALRREAAITSRRGAAVCTSTAACCGAARRHCSHGPDFGQSCVADV